MATSPDPSAPNRPALYRIVDTRADGACLWATLAPVRTGGEPVRSLFCNPADVAYLGDRSPRHAMATVMEKNGAKPRLLPVTVGLDVSFLAASPAGDTTIAALPRPSPLRLPAGSDELRATIARAIKERRPVAFALSGPRTIIDAAPIDRDTALAMLGMQEERPAR